MVSIFFLSSGCYEMNGFEGFIYLFIFGYIGDMGILPALQIKIRELELEFGWFASNELEQAKSKL